MRCFIAVPIPEDERLRIWRASEPLRTAVSGDGSGKVAWVRPESMHITLVFVGELDAQASDDLDAAFSRIALPIKQFSIQYDGIGRFPERSTPRVFFTRVVSGGRECAVIERHLRASIPSLPDSGRKDFTPHITLGRVKSIREPGEYGIREISVRGSFPVTGIVLYESILKPSGAEYRHMRTADLLP